MGKRGTFAPITAVGLIRAGAAAVGGVAGQQSVSVTHGRTADDATPCFHARSTSTLGKYPRFTVRVELVSSIDQVTGEHSFSVVLANVTIDRL
jgi:hypothetical protein